MNRAPVLTLWVAAVAQRQGFSRDAALTFGKYISGMLAQSKGRAIGIYEDKGQSEEEKAETKRQEEAAGVEHVDVFGMSVKAIKVGRHHHVSFRPCWSESGLDWQASCIAARHTSSERSHQVLCRFLAERGTRYICGGFSRRQRLSRTSCEQRRLWEARGCLPPGGGGGGGML